jgi:hypothetical protein
MKTGKITVKCFITYKTETGDANLPSLAWSRAEKKYNEN